MRQTDTLQEQLNQLEARLRTAERRLREVEAILWDRYSQGYFRTESHSLWDILSQPWDRFFQAGNTMVAEGREEAELGVGGDSDLSVRTRVIRRIEESLRPTWTMWGNIWGERPAEVGRTELY
jgi:hypothetical protein